MEPAGESTTHPSIVDKVMTGSHDLNTWLEGGYEKGVIFADNRYYDIDDKFNFCMYKRTYYKTTV